MRPFQNNDRRAGSTRKPLAVFARERGLVDEDSETQVSDLICNLMHLCDRTGADAFQAVRRGISNYACEMVDDDGLSATFKIDTLIDGGDPREAIAAAQRRYA